MIIDRRPLDLKKTKTSLITRLITSHVITELNYQIGLQNLIIYIDLTTMTILTNRTDDNKEAALSLQDSLTDTFPDYKFLIESTSTSISISTIN